MDKTDTYGAFTEDGLNVEPSGSGLLNGLSFAVKDVFAVKGHTNGAGNPTWKATHAPATQHADAVAALLKNGARLRGMTVTDELMYSLKGDNVHFPPTINPRVPGAFSGGSSSGSAVAAAAGLVDFAIGTDTGGSIRIPSSYCGLFGIRPSHGVVSTGGLIPLAPSFDTVGWMTRDASLLATVGSCLLPEQDVKPYARFYLLAEAWDQIGDLQVKTVLKNALNQMLPERPFEEMWLEGETLPELAETFRIVQGMEAWQAHGQWISEHHPVFGQDIAGRFEAASQMKKDETYREALARKADFSERLRKFLGDNALIAIPTTYGPAPERNAAFEESAHVRTRTMRLTCIAGVSGLPQVTVPVLAGQKSVGLSFLSGYGTDRQLLAFVQENCRRS